MSTMVSTSDSSRSQLSGGSYTTNRTSSRHRQLERERISSFQRSEFWRREEAIKAMVESISDFTHLQPNWDSYGAQPPSKSAITRASLYLGMLGTSKVFPSRVMPSSEGGVALRFKVGSKRTLLEFLNGGDFSLLLYDETGEIQQTNDSQIDAADITSLIEQHMTR